MLHPPPTRFHYAWVIAAVTFMVLLVAAGVRTAPGVLITPLEQEFDWTRADISLAVAIGIIWYGLGGPLAGTLVERLGPRWAMAGGLGLTTLGLGALLTLQHLWQLHLFWGVLIGIGTGAVGSVLGATVALRWFNRHRGLVVGLFGAASAAGQLIFLPSMMGLTNLEGWRLAVRVAALAMGLLIPPVLWLMRDRPEALGLRPYGAEPESHLTTPVTTEQPVPFATAIRTRDFWLLAGSFFVCGYTTNGLIGTHLLPHAIEHGFSSLAAANAVGLMGMMNIIGTLASGRLSDRYDNRVLLAAYYGLRAIAIAFLPFVEDTNGLSIFAIIYGLDWIATVPPTINLTAQRFGRASVGTLYGWIFFAHMIGASVAAYLGGVLHDVLGDYTLAFFSAALLGLIAAGFSMSIRRIQLASARSTS